MECVYIKVIIKRAFGVPWLKSTFLMQRERIVGQNALWNFRQAEVFLVFSYHMHFILSQTMPLAYRSSREEVSDSVINECVCSVMSDFAILWTVAHQAALSTGFSSQEHWSGLPFPPPVDLPDLGIEPGSPVSSALQADPLPTVPSGKPSRWTGILCVVGCWGHRQCSIYFKWFE